MSDINLPPRRRKKFRPGRRFNFHDAFSYHCRVDVQAGQLLVMHGVWGDMIDAELADCMDPALANGRLLIAKYDAPKGEQGIGLPIFLKRGYDTEGRKIGDVVFLGKNGTFVYEPEPGSVVVKQVGSVARIGPANGDSPGEVQLDVTAETNHMGGYGGLMGGIPRILTFPMKEEDLQVRNGLPFTLKIVDTWGVKKGKKGGADAFVLVRNRLGEITESYPLKGLLSGQVFRFDKLNEQKGLRVVPSGGSLEVRTQGKGSQCEVYVLCEITP